MSGAAGPVGHRGGQGPGRDEAGLVRPREREGGDLGRDGDSTVEGFRIDPGNLAQNADGS